MKRNPQQNDNQTVRKITLPTGRTIEVISIERPPEPVAVGLHVCPECACDLVQPVAWAEPTNGFWELELSCPNCRWSTEGVFGEDEVYRLEDRIDEGLETMLRDLKVLAKANMADEIDRFVAALDADHILPEDF